MIFNVGDQRGALFTGDGAAFAQFTDHVFAGLFDKRQQRTQARLAAVFGVVVLAGVLLVAEDAFDRRVDVHPDAAVPKTAQLPDPFAQNGAHLQQGSACSRVTRKKPQSMASIRI
jgi:hypothetical protein